MHTHIAMHLLEGGTKQNEEHYKLQNSSNLASFLSRCQWVWCVRWSFCCFPNNLVVLGKTEKRALEHYNILGFASMLGRSIWAYHVLLVQSVNDATDHSLLCQFKGVYSHAMTLLHPCRGASHPPAWCQALLQPYTQKKTIAAWICLPEARQAVVFLSPGTVSQHDQGDIKANSPWCKLELWRQKIMGESCILFMAYIFRKYRDTVWNSYPHSLESKHLRVQRQLDKLIKKNKSIVTEHKSTVFD